MGPPQRQFRHAGVHRSALQHVSAEELLAVIGELGFQNEQLSIAAESRSNSIVARGDADSLKELETLLMNLDKPGDEIQLIGDELDDVTRPGEEPTDRGSADDDPTAPDDSAVTAADDPE